MDSHKYRPSLKTYSKRLPQDSYKPPEKRQRIESQEPFQGLKDCKIAPSTPFSKKKRSIADYFNTSTRSSSPFTPGSSNLSPTLLKREADTPPSSPPPPISFPSVEACKKRRRRILTTRPALKQIEMASLNVPAAGSAPASDPNDAENNDARSGEGVAPATPTNAHAGPSTSLSSAPYATDPTNANTSSQYNAPTAATITYNALGPTLTLPLSGPLVVGNMVQTQLDLGITTHITCMECRFMYNRTDAQDCILHQRYHDAFVLGVPIGNLLVTQSQHVYQFSARIPAGGDCIIQVDVASSRGWKDLVVNVLNVHVDRDLGAVATGPDHLWSKMSDPEITNADVGDDRNQIPRFKVYIYVKDFGKAGPKRVVALLLAERITKAYETHKVQLQADEFGPFPSIVPNISLEVSEKEHEAAMGINKLWTHKDHRRKGYARRLFETARDTFVWGYRMPRVHVAWTHTTESGARFAERSFCGQASYAFLTYKEDA